MNVEDSPSWVAVQPSLISLTLTLTLPLLAVGGLFWIELEEWVRGALLAALLVAVSIDVYIVRLKSANAIGAFRLVLIEKVSVAPLGEPPESIQPSAVVGANERQLHIKLRFRNPSKKRSSAEAEGVVAKQSYVSTYFTSISYRLPDDPRWRKWLPRVLPIWPDSIERDAFRQVRVLLKWR